MKSIDEKSSRPSAFTVSADKVVQGEYTAKAKSAAELTSNYESPVTKFKNPKIEFKFSINAKDNELPVGQNHTFVCLAASCETPLLEFGKQFKDATSVPEHAGLLPDSKLKIRLDMRNVFSSFASKGYFQTFSGDRIFKEDFKGVYVAGSASPLTWDFDNLMNFSQLKLNDDDGDHIYEVTLSMNKSEDEKTLAHHWKLSTDVSRYPQYKSDHVLTDALYALALEEMVKAVEKDSTFRTGKEWSGVWTRDISYSIILSMSVLQPEVAMKSLLRKVKNGVVIQDTGTGGAYPVSTDRIIWGIAAFEIYKVTGDKNWLKTSYEIVKKSIQQDSVNATDAETGMMKGESSFLDWREQTYPAWMQPADIFESTCLGTNAVHYQANIVLAKMATELSDVATATTHHAIAGRIKNGINKYLWLEDKGYYGQFRYGRNYKMLSPKSEALGEALCVIFGIADADRAKRIVESTPVNDFGIPCIYPQIPNIPPYHNRAVWPFVQSYWTLACAKADNDDAVMQSLNAIYRPAALFLTNKENFEEKNGDYASTQINSDVMLWSISGNIAMVYKVLFGMEFLPDGILFHPFVPVELQGTRKLTNFKYRDATIDIELSGSGSGIAVMKLDGKDVTDHIIPSTLTGAHSIRIELSKAGNAPKANIVDVHTSPETPAPTLVNGILSWPAVAGATQYKVFSNAKMISAQVTTQYRVETNSVNEYQIIAIDSTGAESFASEPLVTIPENRMVVVEAESKYSKMPPSYKGFSGEGFLGTALHENTEIILPVDIDEEATYAIDFRYANGNGPVNTENKCGVRHLLVNNNPVGTIVFPQRGKGEWSDWGFTNTVQVKIPKGKANIILRLDPENTNMNGDINAALIDYMRVIRLNP